MLTGDKTANATYARPTARPADTAHWHALPVGEVFGRLASHPERGLEKVEAARRLGEHGPNALAEVKGRSNLAVLLDQFKSLIVILLLAAAGVAFVLGENVEAVAILVVIGLNAAIGFLTEWRARQALAALREQAVPSAWAVRGGETVELPSAELVPGDLVVLDAGARVPADGRLGRGGGGAGGGPAGRGRAAPDRGGAVNRRVAHRREEYRAGPRR
jgi:magnesium-transporting ATPase (P-type)